MLTRWRFLRVAAGAVPVLFVASLALADGKFFANLVPNPGSLDAGIDTDGDGTNEEPNIPLCPGSNEDTDVGICDSGASAGAACSLAIGDSDCGTGMEACDDLDPDGITDADRATSLVYGANGKKVITKKSKCQVKDQTLKVTVFFADTDGDGTFEDTDTDENKMGTASLGVCDESEASDPNGYLACKTAANCQNINICPANAQDNADRPCGDNTDCGVTVASNRGHCSVTTTTECKLDSNCPAAETCEEDASCGKGCFGTAVDAGDGCASTADCTTPNICRTRQDGFGNCLSGDEYWVQLVAQIGSNADNSPACAQDCIAGVDVGGGTVCNVGTCDGGGRDGQLCDAITGGSILTRGCPGGGSCETTGLPAGSALSPSRDELSFNFTLAGTPASLTLFCPMVFNGVGFPFESSPTTGKGKLTASLNLADAFAPSNMGLEVKGCFIHDQAGEGHCTSDTPKKPCDDNGDCTMGTCVSLDGISHNLPLGVVVDDNSLVMGHEIDSAYVKNACPNNTLLLSQGYLETAVGGGGLNINVPVSRILAAAGGTGGKIKCDANADCNSTTFPGGCIGGNCMKCNDNSDCTTAGHTCQPNYTCNF